MARSWGPETPSGLKQKPVIADNKIPGRAAPESFTCRILAVVSPFLPAPPGLLPRAEGGRALVAWEADAGVLPRYKVFKCAANVFRAVGLGFSIPLTCSGWSGLRSG